MTENKLLSFQSLLQLFLKTMKTYTTPITNLNGTGHSTLFEEWNSASGIVESPVPGVTLTTVLEVSTVHMPDIDEDLSECSWGSLLNSGTEFLYAYQDPFDGLPDWLFKICKVARDKYNANWVLLDPGGHVFEDDFPVYDPD